MLLSVVTYRNAFKVSINEMYQYRVAGSGMKNTISPKFFSGCVGVDSGKSAQTTFIINLFMYKCKVKYLNI